MDRELPLRLTILIVILPVVATKGLIPKHIVWLLLSNDIFIPTAYADTIHVPDPNVRLIISAPSDTSLFPGGEDTNTVPIAFRLSLNTFKLLFSEEKKLVNQSHKGLILLPKSGRKGII